MAGNGTILISNDNAVLLQNYALITTNALVVDANASFTVYSDDGTGGWAQNPQVPPQTLTVEQGLSGIAMAYYGSTGLYAGVLPGSAKLTVNAWFWVQIVMSNYSDCFQGWFQGALRTPSTG